MNWIKEKNIWFLGGFFVLGFILILQSWPESKAQQQEKTEEAEPWNVDTLIPAGLILVPIEIQNFTTFSAMVGDAAVVDLWTYNTDSERRSKKIATQIKIIRAPLDATRFGILVPEHEAGEILIHGDQFYVTIHNPKKNESKIIQKKLESKKVHFESFEN